MKITFLGTGGGRFSAISQRRMTGGFRIDNLNGKNYHVDPGPGALVRTYQFGFDPRNLDGVFISHAHTDHYNDAEILIEAMTRGMTKEYGVILGNKSVLDGFERWGPAISKYHQSHSKKYVLEENKSENIGGFSIKGTKTIHGDPKGIGFQIDYKGFKISYTSDTGYFEDLPKYHEGADILIASVLRPGNKSIKGHLCSRNFIELLKNVKPKLAIMTHFGLKMLSIDPIDEAKRITRESGVKTLAAFDGMSFEVNTQNPVRTRIKTLKDVNSQIHSSNIDLNKRERKNTYQSSLRNGETDELTIGKND
ncbi:MBL fold metallo-hydrolase [uncultured Methanobrevibacter sp.]|uniref:MBL fold metallo-hydrolase n=1 Tax=uncultured Methanobrevibacter sp. TaxID=253161 RepID=UPI00260CF6AF|nr:MBL fold metallo-hydrolase [uncultured Methanobrevibacter sp.]